MTNSDKDVINNYKTICIISRKKYFNRKKQNIDEMWHTSAQYLTTRRYRRTMTHKNNQNTEKILAKNTKRKKIIDEKWHTSAQYLMTTKRSQNTEKILAKKTLKKTKHRRNVAQKCTIFDDSTEKSTNI